MKKLILTLLLLISFPVVASHIVGGEFELIYVSGTTYRINMILYFDLINGNPDAKDPRVTVSIFRKSDNAKMTDISLPLVSESPVSYTQPSCSNGGLQTKKIVYSSTIDLLSSIYNDPQGYYISWQRCCRNYNIDNIYSQAPGGSLYAGQTFYLEFPPVVKNGQPFINSSPRLFPPLNDYACPYRLYYVDFAGIDNDKDSLVYSLVTPLNTKSSDPLPIPSPAPYPEVIWKPGFSIHNIMNGNPDLSITKDGFLTVSPSGNQSLYVFAVKVEEYRNKIKIGESRRDFQMLVVDACPVASPPVITGKKKTDATFTYKENMSVSFSDTIEDTQRCIQVRVSDIDSTKPDQNFTENIGIRVVGLNFKNPDLNQILPSITTAILTNGSTKDFEICFPQCSYTTGPYQIGIIAYDDACSLPLSDTLRVTVTMQPRPNSRARFIKPTSKYIKDNVREGETLSWDIEGIDPDNDILYLNYTTNGFELEEYGFRLANNDLFNQIGSIKNTLTWEPRCDKYPFFKQNNFIIRFLLDDMDPCYTNLPDTLIFDLSIQEFPKNAAPTISTSGLGAPPDAKVIRVSRTVLEPLNFWVLGNDTDNDYLQLNATGQGFNMIDLGVSFPNVTGYGSVSSEFRWNIKCDKINLETKNTYGFKFILIDNLSKCRFYKADTLLVELEILKPNNIKPVISAFRNTTIINTDSTSEFLIGQPLEINLVGTDADRLPMDTLSLNLIEANGDLKPEGYLFKNVRGVSGIQSLFTWNPDCSIFKNNIYSNLYSFKFNVSDNRCLNQLADTLELKVAVSDVGLNQKPFYMPNVITPNDDKQNDYFALEGFDETALVDGKNINLNEVVSLPVDNCTQKFESVSIFNRWGDIVFQSSDRTFRWYALHEPEGVYYYVVKYNNRVYKSTLSVLYKSN
jgi:hypothetical protein